MLWNLLGLQRKLDSLFDDGWIRLGVDSGSAHYRLAWLGALSAYLDAADCSNNPATADCTVSS
jgi:hypothetical protein